MTDKFVCMMLLTFFKQITKKVNNYIIAVIVKNCVST